MSLGPIVTPTSETGSVRETVGSRGLRAAEDRVLGGQRPARAGRAGRHFRPVPPRGRVRAMFPHRDGRYDRNFQTSEPVFLLLLISSKKVHYESNKCIVTMHFVSYAVSSVVCCI